MAAYNKCWFFTEHLAKKAHNLSADALTIALSPTASPAASSLASLAAVSQIAYTNLTPAARTPTISGCTNTSGTLKLVLADLTLSATGAVAAFGRIWLYNDTATTPA
ncbi:MAG TPA: hypothetical protein VFK30_11835, partial [Anaerolineae bacterium]|nr:hypothetical protein [Anaerolineae bacterium]